jgi:hypothetical protein
MGSDFEYLDEMMACLRRRDTVVRITKIGSARIKE